MQYFSLLCFIVVSIASTNSHASNANQYPKSDYERRLDEMGSIIGDEGLIFHINGKSDSKKQLSDEGAAKEVDVSAAKYLWNATLGVLIHAPLVISDQARGIAVTDWYSNKEDPHVATKTEVEIIGAKITKDALRVVVSRRIFKNGRWLAIDVDVSDAENIANAIVERAERLYELAQGK